MQTRLEVIVMLLVLIPAVSFAQEGPVSFELSFSNPGARALGFGGAFAALADDATAAFANPAGLVQLIEPEVSLEGRRTVYDLPFVEGGRVSGEPTGIDVDTVAGLRIGRSRNEVNGLSFVSAVLPGERWSLAVYRHQWADFSLSREVNGLFALEDGEDQRSEDVLATTDLSVVNYGVAGAYELSDTVSIGVGVVYFEATLDADSEEYGILDDEMVYAPNPFTSDLLDTSYANRGDDSGTVLHAGLLWRPSTRWSLGAYARQGPEITMSVVEITGPANDDEPPGTIEVDTTSPLRLPDVYGVGVAYRSDNGAWTVSAEWTRVLYSQVTDSLDATVFDVGQVQLDDGDQLHLGLEYVLTSWRPLVALRAGLWHDPAHGLGPGPDADVIESSIFNGGDSQMHYCAGIGLAFQHFQLDLGLDLADTVDRYSLSMVYRF